MLLLGAQSQNWKKIWTRWEIKIKSSQVGENLSGSNGEPLIKSLIHPFWVCLGHLAVSFRSKPRILKQRRTKRRVSTSVCLGRWRVLHLWNEAPVKETTFTLKITYNISGQSVSPKSWNSSIDRRLLETIKRDWKKENCEEEECISKQFKQHSVINQQLELEMEEVVHNRAMLVVQYFYPYLWTLKQIHLCNIYLVSVSFLI